MSGDGRLMNPLELQHVIRRTMESSARAMGKDGVSEDGDVSRGGRGSSPGAVYTQVKAMHQLLGVDLVLSESFSYIK